MTTGEDARNEVLGQLNDEIQVMISKKDGVRATIHNGPDGVIKRMTVSVSEGDEEKEHIREICRFFGEIGPAFIIDGVPGLRIKIDEVDKVFCLSDAKTFLRNRLAIPPSKMQYLMEILAAYVHGMIRDSKAEIYNSSPIVVNNDGLITVDRADHDVASILRSLDDFYPYASNKTAFGAVMSWALIAPLHYDFKTRSVQELKAPLTLETGRTEAGKTALGSLFIGLGYGLSKEDYFYGKNAIATLITMTDSLNKTNLPCLFDDVDTAWLLKFKEDLKSYSHSGLFGQRGRSDLSIAKYQGKRSFLMTMNSDVPVDADLAMNTRMIIERFDEAHSNRMNIDLYNALLNSLPAGFMLDIFRSVLAGVNIADILKTVETFKSGADWINYGLSLINGMCEKYRLPKFDRYVMDEDKEGPSLTFEIAQGFVEEWQRIETGEEYFDKDADVEVRKGRYHSPVEGAIKIERKDGRIHINFTPTAFKTLTARLFLKAPFVNATEFINNIQSDKKGVQVEREGKLHGVWFTGQALKAYTISIPEAEEDE